VEGTHVKLASGYQSIRAVRATVDVKRAHTANTFAAIVVECYGLFAIYNQFFVEYVHHFEERTIGRHTVETIGLELSFVFGALLPPNFDILLIFLPAILFFYLHIKKVKKTESLPVILCSYGF
jgi:hypothetical protein